MKQIVSNYSYSPTTNVVTLTGVNIEQDQLLLVVAPQVGRTLYNFASVTGVVSAGADTRVTLNASTAGLTTTSPLVIFYDDQGSTQTIAGTVTVGASSVTFNANVGTRPDGSRHPLSLESGSNYLNARVYPSDITPFLATVTVGNSVTIGSLPAISGTVTANVTNAVTINSQISGYSDSARVVSKSSIQFTTIAGAIAGSKFEDNYTIAPFRITGDSEGNSLAVDLRRTLQGTNVSAIDGTNTAAFVRTQVVGGSVTIGSLPRVTFVDGSGTVTTANTAITVFASSSTRSYLLVQVTTGSAFVNVGATATTVNGINLTAGQGYAWETTIPQGIVSLISTTTSSRYVAKEA